MGIPRAALITAFLRGTVDVQNMECNLGKARSSPRNTDQQKAEQVALGRIPEPKDSHDPWRNAR